MDITPALVRSHGIEGNLMLVAKDYFVVDTTRYRGREPIGGSHRLVAYCRCCFKKLAAAAHALSQRAFEILEELIGRVRCKFCAPKPKLEGGSARIHVRTGNGCGHSQMMVSRSQSIGR